MGRAISGVKENLLKTAAVAGVVILLVFAAGCSGDLLGYIKDMITQAECKGIIDLPKTGQTTWYATGDDGDLQMGVAWPSTRFAVGAGAESVCITDNLTGLMWEQAPSSTQVDWAEALTYANGLSLGGHSNWRLPNVNELESLINAGQADSAAWLIGQSFSNLQAGIYWSSTTCAPNTTLAWVIDLGSGSMLMLTHDKTNINYVLAVRAGE